MAIEICATTIIVLTFSVNILLEEDVLFQFSQILHVTILTTKFFPPQLNITIYPLHSDCACLGGCKNAVKLDIGCQILKKIIAR